MFKEALKDLASNVLSSTKATIKSYSPTKGFGQGSAFERIAEQGIANLSYRSPIMADIASTMLQNFQLEQKKKSEVKAFVQSDAGSEMRQKMMTKLGPTATEKQVDSEMIKALNSIAKLLEQNGPKSTKETDIYKEFGSYFEKMVEKENPKQETGPQTTPVNSSDPLVRSVGESVDQLNKIEINTNRTVNTLEEIAMRNDLSGSRSTVSGRGEGGTSSGTTSYIDPLTGLPSAKIAIGAIGGKFLSNIFSDDVIENFANKAKKFLKLTDIEERLEPKTSTVAKSTEETLKTVSEKTVLNKKQDISTSIKDVLKDISLDLGTKEEDAEDDIAAEKQSKAQVAVASETLLEIKKLNESGQKIEKAEGKSVGSTLMDAAKGKVLGKIASKVPGLGGLLTAVGGIGSTTGGISGRIASAGTGILGKALTAAGSAASYLPAIGSAISGAASAVGSTLASGVSAIAPFAAPAAGVAAAGAAGYGVGKYAVNPLINKGIEAATGKKDSTLGSWLYDKFNSDQNSQIEAMLKGSGTPSPVDVAKRTTVSELVSAQEKKEQMVTKTSQTPPTVILNSNTSSGASSGQPTIIAPTSVRNAESTFERVQMQNFWPRSF